MGEAKRRGSFEERKAQAIERGDSKERGRRRRADARQAGKNAAYKAMMMAHILSGKVVV